MFSTEKVSKIMTRKLVTVQVTDNLKHIIDLVRKAKVRHIPVVSGDTVKGTISSTDLNRLSFSNLFEQQDLNEDSILDMLTIEQVMQTNPTTVNLDSTIKEVAEIFANAHFHALPVVDNGHLVGIVTTTDIIQFFLVQSEL